CCEEREWRMANGEWPTPPFATHHSPFALHPCLHRPLEPGPRQIGLVQGHADAGEGLAVLAQCALPGGLGHGVEDVAAEELRGREPARKLRQRVEVLVG